MLEKIKQNKEEYLGILAPTARMEGPTRVFRMVKQMTHSIDHDDDDDDVDDDIS
jgi:hypothetical protein